MREKKEHGLKNRISKKNNNELYWVIGTIAVLAIVFFASYNLFSSFKTFQYEELTFTKEKFGDIPVFHYYYFYNYAGEQFKYNLYLRNDPRKNTVPLTGAAIQNDIKFSLGKFVYISLDPNNSIAGCEYSAVGIGSLSSFFVDNQIKVRSASTDRALADELDIQYAECGVYEENNVIILKSGPETKIIREDPICTIIEIANCEVMEAIEKYQVEALLNARERRLE
jgi:heme/copper-type cytochrome/quinol oxidase subunit 2